MGVGREGEVREEVGGRENGEVPFELGGCFGEEVEGCWGEGGGEGVCRGEGFAVGAGLVCGRGRGEEERGEGDGEGVEVGEAREAGGVDRGCEIGVVAVCGGGGGAAGGGGGGEFVVQGAEGFGGEGWRRGGGERAGDGFGGGEVGEVWGGREDLVEG